MSFFKNKVKFDKFKLFSSFSLNFSKILFDEIKFLKFIIIKFI